MNRIFLLTSVVFLLNGCASNNLTMPHGKWRLINQTGFIPANTERYIEGIDVHIATVNSEGSHTLIDAKQWKKEHQTAEIDFAIKKALLDSSDEVVKEKDKKNEVKDGSVQ